MVLGTQIPSLNKQSQKEGFQENTGHVYMTVLYLQQGSAPENQTSHSLGPGAPGGAHDGAHVEVALTGEHPQIILSTPSQAPLDQFHPLP